MALRVLVVLLALLAGGKVAWQEHVYRSALRDTIATAYRDRAARACELDPRTGSPAVAPGTWLAARDVEVRVPSGDFWSWPLAAEPRAITQPSIVLTVATPTGSLACAYNVVTATATLAGG